MRSPARSNGESMFTIDNKITDLRVKERSIYKILYSMNSHPVATPEMNVEEARCYILFFSEGPNLTSFIGLYLPRDDRKFFYAYTSNPFPFEAAGDVENEARQFAEDMGFLLDEINVSGMAVEDRNNWIEDQFIFGYKKPELPDEEDVEEVEEEEEEEAAAETEPEEEEEEEEPASKPAEARKIAGEEKPATAEEKPEPTAAPPVQEPTPPVPPAPHEPASQPGPTTAPQQTGPPAYQPPQPYPGYPQQMPPQYPPAQPPPDLEIPDLEGSEEAEPTRSRSRQQARPEVRKKAPPAKVPIEMEEDDEAVPKRRDASRAASARQSQPRAQTSSPGTAGTVTRDKEALARLLSSF